MTILITHILTLLTFMFGYIIGQNSQPDRPLELKFPKIIRKKHVIGAIPKLTQTQIERKGTRYEAAEKAMEETLRDIL
jgi:hypothetical protein